MSEQSAFNSDIGNDQCDPEKGTPDMLAAEQTPVLQENPTVFQDENDSSRATAQRPSKSDLLGRLGAFLEDATSRGLFPLLAYGVDNDNFLVLTTSIIDLPLGMKILKEVNREYNLGKSLQVEKIARLANENPHVFRKHLRLIEGLDEIEFASLGKFVSLYGTPYFPQKAFGLIDICGFSVLNSSEQLAQLYSLTNVLGSATRRCVKFCDRLRMRGVFGRASTGDGYYVWSDAIGGNADVATFMALICMLTQCEQMYCSGFQMRVKASFVIGGAFMLYDPTRRSERNLYEPASNAIGPATNCAARLLTACKPGQLLMGDFKRPGQGGEDLTPAGLIAQANELFREENSGAGKLAITPTDKLRVDDKHGSPWYCWNVSGEVPSFNDRVKIGLQLDESTDVLDLNFR